MNWPKWPGSDHLGEISGWLMGPLKGLLHTPYGVYYGAEAPSIVLHALVLYA